MRLIDGDALMETIRAHDYPLRAHFNSTDNGMFTLGIQQAVDEQPTVDAVPVVRCCECKKCATDECCFFARGEWGMSGPDWNFYCADGERKGGDE